MKKIENATKYIIWLVILLLTVFGLDKACSILFGELTLAPPLAIIALGILAAFFSWRKVLCAVPLFMGLSYLLVMDFARFPVIRSVSVGLAGVLAIWAAFQRSKLVVHAGEVEAILEKLPLPWVLSDEFGNINQISPKALQMLSLDSSLIVGTSYFSIFTPQEDKGELIRRYLDLFSVTVKPISTRLSSSPDHKKKFKATLAPLEVPGGKRILTTFEAN